MLFNKLDYEIYTINKYSTLDWKLYLKKNNKFISIFNDIPLKNNDGTFNMICEIPKYTRKKMEINYKEEYSPIKQDINKDGTLRDYNWGDMLFNYGAFPQTWENPHKQSNFINKYGDNDPLDVIDIGDSKSTIGMVYKVKILGILGMIDQDELDWKVIAININDPIANKLNSIDDINKYKPGVLSTIKEWFRVYKIVDGKDKNEFIFNEQYNDSSFAIKIINETHNEWLDNRELFNHSIMPAKN